MSETALSRATASAKGMRTKAALMEAAGPIFAEHGFRRATVREICRRAGANLAAIHYHFGDKQALYRELVLELGRRGVSRYPPDEGVQAGAKAPERLRAFVRSLLLRLRGEGVPTWQARLLAHETIDPSPALDLLVEETIRPLFKRLCGIVGELLGPRADPDRVILAARSVVAQCVFYHTSRPIIARLTPGDSETPERLERVAAHIAEFSLGALSALAKESGS
jgi:AcrR family transcriptional regulator